MKKTVVKIMSLALAAVMSAGALVSCKQTVQKPVKFEEYTGDFRERYDYDLNEYIQVGEYKGLEVNINAGAPTEQETKSQILNYRIMYTATISVEKDVPEGVPSETGFAADVKYQGYLDGEKIEALVNKKDTGDTIILGKDEIIDGADAQITGMTLGEKKTVTVTVPEVCLRYPELQGKTITLDVEFVGLRSFESKWQDAGEGATAQMNDIVDIKYQGYLDGKPLSDIVNSKKDGYSAALGTEGVLPGFDEQIVGMKVGDKKTVSVTVPDPCFNYPYYVGKTIDIDVEVVSIRRAELEPYDEALFDYYGCGDQKSFEDQAIGELRRVRSENLEDYILDRVMYMIADNFTVKQYPEKELEEVRAGTIESTKSMAESRKVSYEDYVMDTLGMSVSEYEKSVDDYAKDVVKHEMVMYYIARAEKIALTNAAFDEKAEELAIENELSTPAEYVSYMMANGYSESSVREQVWFELTYDFVYSNTKTK